MRVLGERPVWSMSGGEMLSTLDAVNAEIARLKTYGLHLVGGLEDTGYAKEIGAHDTVRLLTFRYRVDSIEAHRDVRLARALPKYPAVAAALPDTTSATSAADFDTTAHPDDTDHTNDTDVDGAAATDGAAADGVAEEAAAGGAGGRPLHPAQAQAIVWALERVAARVPVEHLAVAEEQLVGLAARLSPGQLRKAGKEIGDLLDSDGPGPDEDRAYSRESLTLSNAENGVKFRGFLANDNAELFRALIHAGARPRKTVDGELDPRPREKRQADALTSALTIAAAATDTGYTPPTNTGRAAATAQAAPTETGDATPTADSARAATDTDSAGATRDAATTTIDGPTAETGGPAETGGRSGGRVPGFGAKANITVTIDFNDLKAATADATGQLVYGDALSAAAIRRLACDAAILPLVLGSNSEPLDVGRSERLVNRAMRRALNARDKGCVVCGAPPIQCDAHHLRSWIDGGLTAISNLVLLCKRHHIDLHAGHWTITITNGTVHVSRPTWADPPPVTRRAAQGHPPAHARADASSPNGDATRPDANGAAPCPTPNQWANEPAASEQSLNKADETSGSESIRPDPWHEPAASGEGPRSWWQDDEAARQEAVRFAVWGDESTPAAPEKSGRRGRPVDPAEAAGFNPVDPWGDASVPSDTADLASRAAP
ncbi:uncharacterized protein DUF222 [Kribbella sp. VKM Ac-2527]|uniref:Uncharacterized protein DUF222 n=1 Tax=Kribbella caucasensis TaxID=2512215 RepID=A0A4R6KRD2_9ACTN|nr:HNH endonuclease signature motif containing protein [Kribbella sp. VKM Ac-2527]TDO52459.1 uncharacterized protein DUF222 [Kribbella sp. VKM Ac-2527]